MTDIEILTAILNKLDNLENKFDNFENRMDNFEIRMDRLENRMDNLEQDMKSVKKTCLLVENDIAPKVQVLLEAHSDLAKNVAVAKNLEERVGVLEFDVSVLKGLANAR